tara:strand:- start:138 stop:314 length:177 start_codon:yes stop_codon:yes gene_type:complete
MYDDEEEGIDLDLRNLIHSEGFVMSDEVKEDESGTWIKVDFFDSIMNLLKKFGLIGEK